MAHPAERLPFLDERGIRTDESDVEIGRTYFALFGLDLNEIVKQVQEQMKPACDVAAYEAKPKQATSDRR